MDNALNYVTIHNVIFFKRLLSGIETYTYFKFGHSTTSSDKSFSDSLLSPVLHKLRKIIDRQFNIKKCHK